VRARTLPWQAWKNQPHKECEKVESRLCSVLMKDGGAVYQRLRTKGNVYCRFAWLPYQLESRKVTRSLR
jgi:hypothetical protein